MLLSIEHETHGHIGDSLADVLLTYDVTDPLAVAVTIDVSDGDPQTWIFARELLAHGLAYPCGKGDVIVSPTVGGFCVGGQVSLLLFPDTPRRCVVALPKIDVRAFLQAASAAVPFGAEERLVDAALDDFIATLPPRAP